MAMNMKSIDYENLMIILSVPRPNGSQAERRTSQALQRWLAERGIPYQVQGFRNYPYFFESIGIFLIFFSLLLAAAIWFRWGWVALLLALIAASGGTLDIVLNTHLVSWPGARRGENIIISFEPEEQAEKEVIISAHYDSKTEPLDHQQRMILLKSLPAGVAITLILGILGWLDGFTMAAGLPWAEAIFWTAAALTLPMLFLALALGVNLSIGRLLPQSQGAVDNGSSCAVVLGLAARLQEVSLQLRRTRVTLALFTGEEVKMQGSRAYVQERAQEGWSLPIIAVNLEVMAQDGEYVYWEMDGHVFRLSPTSEKLNQALSKTVEDVTGCSARPAGPVNSDGASFLQAGIPVAVLGTSDKRWMFHGFHKPTDNLDRVVVPRLAEGALILERFVEKYDRGEIKV